MAHSPIVVQKYGGSSVANPEKIKAVARRVAKSVQAGQRICVVVSAMGDTTDELLSLARQITDTPERRELDMLLTAGERISMALLALALNDLGIPCISFTGSQSGIITNDSHSNARIVEVRPYRIQDELERGKVVIVAGFQGVSYRKEVTTLGRGGSDTTAVALAAALGADWCEICSDVDGVYSSDPRIVSDAKKLASLSYEEMQELAESGARVLNATAIEFARQKGIAVYAKATFVEGPGTVVRAGEPVVRLDEPPKPGRVQAVAAEADVVVLRLADATVSELCELSSLLDASGIASRQTTLEVGRATLLVSLEDAHLLRRCWGQVRERFGARAVLEEGLGSLGAVGAGIHANHQNLRTALEALAAGEVPVHGVFTTSYRLGFLVPKERVKDGVRLLHDALVS